MVQKIHKWTMKTQIVTHGVYLGYCLSVRTGTMLLRGSATAQEINLVGSDHVVPECVDWQSKQAPGYPGVAGILEYLEVI